MSDPIYRPVSVTMKPIRWVTIEGTFVPVRDCRVITENGQIWERTLQAFGLSHDTAESEYRHHREKWIRLGDPDIPTPPATA